MNKYDLHNRRAVVLLSILTGLMIVFIWSNSCLSREESGAQSGRITAFLLGILDPDGRIPVENFHHFVRKMAHFTEFALLGGLMGSLFCCIGRLTGQRLRSLPVLLVLLVAVADEYLQYFTGRGSMVTDVVLDFAGAIFGLGLVALVSTLRKNK